MNYLKFNEANLSNVIFVCVNNGYTVASVQLLNRAHFRLMVFEVRSEANGQQKEKGVNQKHEFII